MAGAGCDQGHQDDLRAQDHAPAVRVVGTNFGGGAVVPANGSVQVAFDRVLHPASVNRQAAVVIEVGGRAVGNPAVSFDPVTRVLSLSGPNGQGSRWLTPGLPYELVLTDANAKDSIGGVRATDGAAIALDQPRVLAFFAGAEVTDERARGFDPPVEFCRDVLPVFRAKCSGSQCHGAPRPGFGDTSRLVDGQTRPAQGLVLDTSVGVANTALSRVAQESNTGPRAGLGAPALPRIFGIDMAIVEPANPGSSWLLYKVMMAAPADPFGPVDAGTAPPSAAPIAQKRCDGSDGPAPVVIGAPLAPWAPITDEERSRFSNSMLGSPMPYPSRPGTDDRSQHLTYEELERLRIWIAQGAKVQECGACLP